ncbi:MAG: FimV/HubP family polar landmark protein, partial [Pseudomonadota bacterium]|nr:FimV/HubP family polar landmark protein [Pseudomonadota bacterium]
MKNKRPFFRVLLVLMFAVVAHAESYYGPTVKNDRLYQIALALRPVDASVSQTMAALYELNKGAFLDSNINKLQTGSLLQVPTPYQIKAIPLKQANSLVSSH